jgi:hypothetical protein
MNPPKKLKLVYMLIGGGALSLYAASGLLGWELSSGTRQKLPASVRAAPGGYAAFHFWHSGYRGGK